MKNLFKFAWAALLAVAVVAMPACNEKDPVDEPVKPELSVAEKSIDATNEGGEFTLHINSNSDWTVAVDVDGDWVTVNPAEGTGEAEVAVKVLPYEGMEDRTAAVTVTVATLEPVVIPVSQSANEVATIDVTELTAGNAAAVLTVNVTANKAWEIAFEETTDWAALAIGDAAPAQKVSGDSSAAVKVNVQENAGYADRSATLLFTAEGEEAVRISLSQTSAPGLTVAEALAKVDGVETEDWNGKVGDVFVYAVSEEGFIAGDATGSVFVESAAAPTVKVGDKVNLIGTLAVVWEKAAKIFTTDTVATVLSSDNTLPALTPVSEDYDAWLMDTIGGAGFINGAQYIKIVGNQGVKTVQEYDWEEEDFTGNVFSYQIVKNPDWEYGTMYTPFAKTNAELLAALEDKGVTVYGWAVATETLDEMSWGSGSEIAIYVDKVNESPKIVGKPQISIDVEEVQVPAAGITGVGESNVVAVQVLNRGDYELKASATAPFTASVEVYEDPWGMGGSSTEMFLVTVEALANESEEAKTGTLTIYMGDESNPVVSETVGITQAGAVSGKEVVVDFAALMDANTPTPFQANVSGIVGTTDGGESISLTFTKVSEVSGYKTGWHNGSKKVDGVTVDSTPIKGISILKQDAFSISSVSGNVKIKKVEILGYTNASHLTAADGLTEIVYDMAISSYKTAGWCWTGETTSLDLVSSTNKYGSVQAIRITYSE